MRLPAWLLPHTGVLEPYTGAGAHGPTYAPPVPVSCYFEDDRTTERTPDDRKVTSRARVWSQLDEPFTPESRFTVNGDTFTVLTVKRRDFGAPTPNHLEVALR